MVLLGDPSVCAETPPANPGHCQGVVFACVHKRRDICQPGYIWAEEKPGESLSLAIVVDSGGFFLLLPRYDDDQGTEG